MVPHVLWWPCEGLPLVVVQQAAQRLQQAGQGMPGCQVTNGRVTLVGGQLLTLENRGTTCGQWQRVSRCTHGWQIGRWRRGVAVGAQRATQVRPPAPLPNQWPHQPTQSFYCTLKTRRNATPCRLRPTLEMTLLRASAGPRAAWWGTSSSRAGGVVGRGAAGQRQRAAVSAGHTTHTPVAGRKTRMPLRSSQLGQSLFVLGGPASC